ncbi:protein S100-A16 [Alligator sinensis]|uniref:Protein S100 n=1 Tax=Alligator sinensis TaxID=38654 RepID=A0A3Q0HD75_ALLSI|nr:protein S100-A16 [Alligator sinensis]
MTNVQQQHTDLECAVEMLVKNFEKYAGGGGCCCRKQPRRISKKDFRKMLTRELNHMLTDTGNKRAADKLICDLDENKDGRISFEEYWTLIGGIASPIAGLIRQQVPFYPLDSTVDPSCAAGEPEARCREATAFRELAVEYLQLP